MNNQSAWVAAFGRLLIAAIFLFSGFGKIVAPEATQSYIASAGLPLPMVGYVIAIIIEVGGGILLLIGYQARITALIMAIFSVFAAFSFHNNFGDQNQMIHFMKNLCIAGGLLQIVAFGAGSISIDGRRLAT
jgi:putative oxidoreductase